MKKTKKILTVILAVALTVILAVAPAGAAMEYSLYGFRFTLKNNNEAVITGYENKDPAMRIPAVLLDRDVTAIDNDAFRDNTFITSASFSNATNLKTIGVAAFEHCTGLAGEVTLPASLTGIGYSAFEGCTSLTSLTVQGQVNSLPKWCCYQCSSLTTVTLPESLATISMLSLAYCPNLTYVNIPASVTTIDQYAFYNSPNVTLGVWSDTYGYQYAVANNIPYVLLDAPQPQPIPYLLGDATGDGYVNVRDVTAIQRHVAEFTLLTGVNFAAADVNSDSIISVDDGTSLQRYLAEFDVAYPIGEEQSYLPE